MDVDAIDAEIDVMKEARPSGLDEDQTEFLLSSAPLAAGKGLTAVDLFSGIGGLSAGFAATGFKVVGLDSSPLAGLVYDEAGFGTSIVADLGNALPASVLGSHPLVVLGGPPCRPWSAVNQQRRGDSHDDHHLLMRFVDHVLSLGPQMIIMENVPGLKSDPTFASLLERFRQSGYSVSHEVLHYERFGAASRRRRLFTVAIRGAPAADFFRQLKTEYRPLRTVGEAISEYRDTPRSALPDHDWSELQTIGKYRARYESGQYGWAKLSRDSPAPSFGSVAKTYILHPDSGEDGFPERVISVREALAIVGFDDRVRFPAGTSRTTRYQMAANAVSPQVSFALAKTARRMLSGP